MAINGTGTGIYEFTASGTITNTLVLVSCRWVGATTAGHQCQLNDLKGNRLFLSEANGANFTDGWAFDRKWVDGVELATMNSGTFYLYESRV